MHCKDCISWCKREILKPRGRKKAYYPAGRCLLGKFNRGFKYMFTIATSNCQDGIRKEDKNAQIPTIFQCRT